LNSKIDARRSLINKNFKYQSVKVFFEKGGMVEGEPEMLQK
jgi:hypothetical protein